MKVVCCFTGSAVCVIIKHGKNNSKSQIFTRLNDIPLLLSSSSSSEIVFWKEKTVFFFVVLSAVKLICD